MSIHIPAVAAGAFIHFLIPAIWYQGPIMGNRWMRLLNKSPEYWEARKDPKLVRTAMGAYAACSIVVATVFFMFCKGGTMAFEGQGGVAFGASTGMILWLATVATDVGQYGFEGRTWKLYPIDKLDRLVSWPLMCAAMCYIAGL
jgi:hypothetical protein